MCDLVCGVCMFVCCVVIKMRVASASVCCLAILLAAFFSFNRTTAADLKPCRGAFDVIFVLDRYACMHAVTISSLHCTVCVHFCIDQHCKFSFCCFVVPLQQTVCIFTLRTFCNAVTG